MQYLANIRSSDDIAKIIPNLDLSKAHGYDNINIRILKICPGIFKLLDIIFKQCVDAGVFPPRWEKGDTVPVHKKTSNKH